MPNNRGMLLGHWARQNYFQSNPGFTDSKDYVVENVYKDQYRVRKAPPFAMLHDLTFTATLNPP